MIGLFQWKQQQDDNTFVYYYIKQEYSITDVVALPVGVPHEANWISANEWRSIVGEPIQMSEQVGETDTGQPIMRYWYDPTFEEMEEVKIGELGWTAFYADE